MNDTKQPNFRMERIEKLLHELRYEITRGMLEREVDETIGFSFVVPTSSAFKNGVVTCDFRTRPIPHLAITDNHLEPRLRVIKGGVS